MFDLIHSCFKDQYKFSHFAALINHMSNVIGIVQTEYTKDKDAKNAAIDALCQILQGMKDSTSDQPQG